MVPELGEKLSVFIALAPAVYAGPLTTGFPFTALKSMKWRTWRRVFGELHLHISGDPTSLTPAATGVLDFIPLMRISYNLTPSKPFGLLGYQMFAFLFNWTDTNWVDRLSSTAQAQADRRSAAPPSQAQDVSLHAVARVQRQYLLVDWSVLQIEPGDLRLT